MLPLLDLHCGGAKGATGAAGKKGDPGTAPARKFLQLNMVEQNTNPTTDGVVKASDPTKCAAADQILGATQYMMCVNKDRSSIFMAQIKATKELNHNQAISLCRDVGFFAPDDQTVSKASSGAAGALTVTAFSSSLLSGALADVEAVAGAAGTAAKLVWTNVECY